MSPVGLLVVARTGRVSTDEATAAFPQLMRLTTVPDVGWVFLPPPVADGHSAEAHGVRTWPDGSVDAIRVHHDTDAAALRCDREGEITWEWGGDLNEVIDGLLTLPAHGGCPAPFRS